MQSTDDRLIGWAYVSPLRRERIEAGVAALARIDKHVTFYDWRMVGEALNDLRAAAMDQAGANAPIGKGYNAAWARVVSDNPELVPLSKLDTATRTNAMWLAEHWEAVAEWHAELDDATRRLVNHPATVRRRFNQDHPLPPKPRAERDEGGESEDEEGELDDESEVYDLGDDREGATAAGTEADIPETVEDWINQFEALWRRMPAVVRAEIAQRIAVWQSEAAIRAAEPAELDLIDEAEAEINRAVAKDEGKKVRALAGRKGATSATNEPTPERLAMTVEEALAKPVAEGEDIFAGLGDDLARSVTPEQVKARRATLTLGAARIIAVRINHPDWEISQIVEDVGRTTIRAVTRVLKENGFKPN